MRIHHSSQFWTVAFIFAVIGGHWFFNGIPDHLKRDIARVEQKLERTIHSWLR